MAQTKSVRVSQEEYEKLKALAKKDHTTIGYYLTRAISNFLIAKKYEIPKKK